MSPLDAVDFLQRYQPLGTAALVARLRIDSVWSFKDQQEAK
jgi:hypothetical protein